MAATMALDGVQLEPHGVSNPSTSMPWLSPSGEWRGDLDSGTYSFELRYRIWSGTVLGNYMISMQIESRPLS